MDKTTYSTLLGFGAPLENRHNPPPPKNTCYLSSKQLKPIHISVAKHFTQHLQPGGKLTRFSDHSPSSTLIPQWHTPVFKSNNRPFPSPIQLQEQFSLLNNSTFESFLLNSYSCIYSDYTTVMFDKANKGMLSNVGKNKMKIWHHVVLL